MSANDDKKFLPKETIPYSPTFYITKMPVLQASFEKLPQPVPALVDSDLQNLLKGH